MKSSNFIEKNILKKVLFGIVLAVFLSIYGIGIVKAFNYKSLEALFLLTYGNLNIYDIKYVIPALVWILPQIYLTYVLGDYISNHLNRNAVYIFTRTDKRRKWLLSRVLNLFAFTVIYYVAQFLIVYLIGSAYGLAIANQNVGMSTILSEFMLLILLSYLFVLTINIMSLAINVTYSYLIVTAVSIISVFITGFIELFGGIGGKLIKLLPTSQGVITWHDSRFLVENYFELFRFSLSDFSLMYSTAYLILFCTVLILWGMFKINRMDII